MPPPIWLSALFVLAAATACGGGGDDPAPAPAPTPAPAPAPGPAPAPHRGAHHRRWRHDHETSSDRHERLRRRQHRHRRLGPTSGQHHLRSGDPTSIKFTHLSIVRNGEQSRYRACRHRARRRRHLVCVYNIHTHSNDQSGRIHMEGAAAATFTLGQFFAVWGSRSRRATWLGSASR